MNKNDTVNAFWCTYSEVVFRYRLISGHKIGRVEIRLKLKDVDINLWSLCEWPFYTIRNTFNVTINDVWTFSTWLLSMGFYTLTLFNN